MTDSITCPRCGMTSYNPNDIKWGYCGSCHDWTSDPTVQKTERSWSDNDELIFQLALKIARYSYWIVGMMCIITSVILDSPGVIVVIMVAYLIGGIRGLLEDEIR